VIDEETREDSGWVVLKKALQEVSSIFLAAPDLLLSARCSWPVSSQVYLETPTSPSRGSWMVPSM
jgi:hypothetical protein